MGELPVYRRILILAATIVLVGLTSSVSSASSWTDSGWGRLAAKAYKSSDRCKNISGVQRKVPAGLERDASGNCQSTPTTTPTTTPTSTTASGPVPAPQSGFTRVLSDEFNGTSVDTSKWSPYSGKLSSSDGCNEPDNLTVAGGVLTQTFAYQSSGTCGAGWYHGSMMVERAYGGNNQSVTVRFRVLNSDTSTQAHRIIPMRWPSASSSGATTPAWYNGESDYCEGSDLTGCTSFLHYQDSSSQIDQSHTFDMTQWHTFRATQKAGNDVQIFIDDMAVPRWSYDGSTTTVPDVFKRTVLQQECESSCPSNKAGWERIEVDYVTIDNQS
jgi:hypothetical protein